MSTSKIIFQICWPKPRSQFSRSSQSIWSLIQSSSPFSWFVNTSSSSHVSINVECHLFRRALRNGCNSILLIHRLLYHSLRDHRINSGIFVRAIVKTPPPVGGTYVRCNVEDLTLESYLATWGRASGTSPTPGSTKVVQLSVEDYCTLWGHMSEEQASQWVFFEFLKEYGITKLPGVEMVEGRDLLSEDDINDLVPTEESLRRMDWSDFAQHKLSTSSHL
jgi:hypothetical protein